MSENATCDAKTDCNDGSDETYTHARCGGKIQTKGCSHMLIATSQTKNSHCLCFP